MRWFPQEMVVGVIFKIFFVQIFINYYKQREMKAK